MATNRIYIRCQACGDTLCLGSTMQQGYSYDRRIDGKELSQKLDDFFAKHNYCGAEPLKRVEYDADEYPLPAGISCNDGAFDIVYEVPHIERPIQRKPPSMKMLGTIQGFGAYAIFKHEPSAQEVATVYNEILERIMKDLRLFTAVKVNISDCFVRLIYRTPEQKEAARNEWKRAKLFTIIDPYANEWTVGIKIEFVVDVVDHEALSRCETRLFEGVSPEPYRIIE